MTKDFRVHYTQAMKKVRIEFQNGWAIQVLTTNPKEEAVYYNKIWPVATVSYEDFTPEEVSQE